MRWLDSVHQSTVYFDSFEHTTMVLARRVSGCLLDTLWAVVVALFTVSMYMLQDGRVSNVDTLFSYSRTICLTPSFQILTFCPQPHNVDSREIQTICTGHLAFVISNVLPLSNRPSLWNFALKLRYEQSISNKWFSSEKFNHFSKRPIQTILNMWAVLWLVLVSAAGVQVTLWAVHVYH